jgi:hypothetical protein
MTDTHFFVVPRENALGSMSNAAASALDAAFFESLESGARIQIKYAVKAIGPGGLVVTAEEVVEVYQDGGSLTVALLEAGTSIVVQTITAAAVGAALTTIALAAVPVATAGTVLAFGVAVGASVIAAAGVSVLYDSFLVTKVHELWADVFGLGNDTTAVLYDASGEPVIGALYADHAPSLKNSVINLIANEQFPYPAGYFQQGMIIEIAGRPVGPVSFTVLRGANPLAIIAEDLGVSTEAFLNATGARDRESVMTANKEVFFGWPEQASGTVQFVQNGAELAINIADQYGARTHRIAVENIMLGGSPLLPGGEGPSWIHGEAAAFGTAGDDVLVRASDNYNATFIAVGGAGNDVIFGSHGADILYGGSAGTGAGQSSNDHDIIDGGIGDDFIVGGGDFDNLKGGSGEDVLIGGGVSLADDNVGDWLEGGADRDEYHAGASDTILDSDGKAGCSQETRSS